MSFSIRLSSWGLRCNWGRSCSARRYARSATMATSAAIITVTAIIAPAPSGAGFDALRLLVLLSTLAWTLSRLKSGSRVLSPVETLHVGPSHPGAHVQLQLPLHCPSLLHTDGTSEHRCGGTSMAHSGLSKALMTPPTLNGRTVSTKSSRLYWLLETAVYATCQAAESRMVAGIVGSLGHCDCKIESKSLLHLSSSLSWAC
mmetsp:Transcript_1573/g.4089  ORF Transcript_1573/g.4089 Transcript_1573/m.4089 type:complete len:201 (-) Transcript_1573:869-1471(-)